MIRRQHIGIEQHAQARQCRGKVLNQAQRLGIDPSQVGVGLACGVTQLQARLGQQRSQGSIEGVANVEVLALLAQVDRAQAHREQRTAQLLKHLAHRLARRQLAPALLANASAIAAAPLLTGAAQAADDAV